MRFSKFICRMTTLALGVGVLLSGCPRTAYASTGEVLSVDSVWLEGGVIRMAVTDKDTGQTQTLWLDLSDYADSGDELLSLQAVDDAGNKSNTVQFKNPYYTESTESPEMPEDDSGGVPGVAKPFTPDGTGTVVDNANGSDGKEFFSIETGDGGVFYLIVDRQRATDNVYLLDTVSKRDLTSLAEGTESAAPTPSPTPKPTPAETLEPVAKKPSGGISGGALIFIIIVAAAVGGLAYYFKIVKPKQTAGNDDDYGEDDDIDDSEIYGEVDGGDEI